jgi:transglutaminase-like putative cysteine protease
MKDKPHCHPAHPLAVTDMKAFQSLLFAAICVLALVRPALAGDAPQWMHAVASVPLPAHDEKTDAVLLYAERSVNVQSAEKIKTHVRIAYKILRPSGRDYGIASVSFNAHSKINGLRGWCIPAQGKDYEVKDKEAIEVSLPKVAGSELISDVKDKFLQIPAADPGNIVGYEYEEEEQPMVLQTVWMFQREIPGRELHFSLQLPPGWEYKTSWINYSEVKPTQSGGNQWEWVVSDIKAIRHEADMPPIEGVAGQMAVSFFPPGGASINGFKSWPEMGKWYLNLTNGRRDTSPQINQQVASLTSSGKTQLEKMKAIGYFVQHDIRYVAIELGVGGWQPHAASEVFTHHYGDCKDKATLMSSMLSQIGVESFYVLINVERGAIFPETPARIGFNHAIIAMKLPAGVSDSSLVATVQHPRLGTLLYFDPTNELTPFGEIGGYLQENYGLLVTSEGGELVELPKQAPAMNSIVRTGTLTLDPSGTLKGDVTETRMGDRAWIERSRLRTITKDTDRVKPIEDLLAGSLSLFRITKASITNLNQTDQPFGFNYTFEAQGYAKNAGGLILVRPRVLGVKTSGLLETKEPRKFPVEFEGPSRDTDTFDITIPEGLVVDDVPPPLDADYGFASYHSKTEVRGNIIHYSRTFEVKDLSVPVAKADELKKFYRQIGGDERNTVVLKAGAK